MLKISITIALMLFSNISFSGIINYSYDFYISTNCDNRCYHDYTRTALQDGILGTGSAQYNASNGWVGWNRWRKPEPVNIDFFFDTTNQINNIDFGGLTNNVQGTLFFSVFSKQSGNWQLESTGSRTSVINSDNRYSITGLSFVTDSVRLAFTTDSGDRWVLLDEVSFAGSTVSVPEPSTLAILALGLMGLASRRFK